VTPVTKVIVNREIKGYKFGPVVSCPILGGSILTFYAQTGHMRYKCKLYRHTDVFNSLWCRSRTTRVLI